MMPDVNNDSSKNKAITIIYNQAGFFKPEDVMQQLEDSLPNQLKKFEGQIIVFNKLTPFQYNDMNLYTQNREIFEKTDIEFTFKLELTKSHEVYEKINNHKGASFSLFLMWTWAKALTTIPEFNFRNINGKWFEFKNLPLFTTLAADPKKPALLNNLLIENFTRLSWEEVCETYYTAKNKLKESAITNIYPYPMYAISHFIVNIPIDMSHASGPMPKKGLEIERPTFAFGQRKSNNNLLTTYVSAKLPHASLNPSHLRKLISNWHEIIESLEPAARMQAKL